MTSVLQLNSGEEFPTLEAANNMAADTFSSGNSSNGSSRRQSPTKKRSPKHKTNTKPSHEIETTRWENRETNNPARDVASPDGSTGSNGDSQASSGSGLGSQADAFVRCRIGSRLIDMPEDFQKVFQQRHIGHLSDFVLAPIAPVRTTLYDANCFEAVSDLALHPDDWTQRVAIDLGQPFLDHFDPEYTHHFDKLFRHALYLSSVIIVISCPDSNLAQATLASITNDRLKDTYSIPLVLFRVSMASRRYCSRPNTWLSTSTVDEINDGGSQPQYCPWKMWNSLRDHLVPDKRIGVCLSIREDLDDNSEEELNRWAGEPVRMIIISSDLFTRSPGTGLQGLRLTSKCRDFIKKVMLANSLKTSLVLETQADLDLAEHMQYLEKFIKKIKLTITQPANLTSWDDKLQPPLQPLSSHLTSTTYSVFEMDLQKYMMYRDAMIESLDRLLSMNSDDKEKRPFVLMVLGAGRGPLVDNFIDAIRAIGQSEHKFIIYALDKNPSSIRALKYKQKHHWRDASNQDSFKVHVIESDMREWQPAGLKADIIATELLGSLSDNELSPECIDGLWTISSPKTMSIPQEYSSHLAPICSFKLFQEVNYLKSADPFAFDRIYVVKLTNYYLIGEPKKLFTFEHRNLCIPASKRCNERFTRLTFTANTDTVCHGFAGYFSAHLFGTTHISTVEGAATPNMNSWFPAFVPLEQPVQLTRGSQLEVLFWRKESSTSVWYEWTIVSPIRSRIYSQSGNKTSMSKFIE